MNCPFTLAQYGYKADPKNPMRFIHPDGHPFYPVVFKDDRSKTSGDTLRAIAEAAYLAGQGGAPEEVEPRKVEAALCESVPNAIPSQTLRCDVCNGGPCAKDNIAKERDSIVIEAASVEELESKIRRRRPFGPLRFDPDMVPGFPDTREEQKAWVTAVLPSIDGMTWQYDLAMLDWHYASHK